MLGVVKGLAPGFLIAMPQMVDPNFHHAVVLVLEHGETGAMGLVINREAPLTLKDLAEGQSMELAASRRGADDEGRCSGHVLGSAGDGSDGDGRRSIRGRLMTRPH